MNKFENVDIIDSLRRIMETNTIHYQTDFELDKHKLRAIAVENDMENKYQLFMSRKHGTYLFNEADVFKNGSYANKTWLFYSDQPQDILAYAVKVKGLENGTVKGDIYELDYAEHCKHVEKSAVEIGMRIYSCANGKMEVPVGKPVYSIDPKLGKLKSYTELPKDPAALKAQLLIEKQNRESLRPGDIERHISKLSRRKKSIKAQLEKSKSKAEPAKSAPKKSREDISL